MTFADLEDEVNLACISGLANATASLSGGVAVNGIFGNEYGEEVAGLAGGFFPVFQFRNADAPGVVVGDSITINGTAYAVAGVEPDGTGWTALILRRT